MSGKYVFDAALVLGNGIPCTTALPPPAPGHLTLRIPDGLSLQSLRDGAVGRKYIHGQYWYDEYGWSKAALPAGTYLLRIPVPGSNRKTAPEQAALLGAGTPFAPVALLAAALLCCMLHGGPDTIGRGTVRCYERSALGDHVVLTRLGWRLGVFVYPDGGHGGSVWASSVRKLS
mgnify:CR=1 FL=1